MKLIQTLNKYYGDIVVFSAKAVMHAAACIANI